MIVTQISIDLSGKYRYEYVVAKQGDADSRLIQVLLLSDSRIYVIDDQTTARVSITKPDKTEVIQDCTVNNNMVEVLLDANMLAAAGTAEAEILLTDLSGTVTSASFDIKVVATNTGKNAESSDDYQSFKDAMAYLQAEKKALAEAKENGEFDGVGIESVEQTTKSEADDGINIVTVTKTDGTQSYIEIKNGSKGEKGDTGKGVESVEQTNTSEADDGINIVTVTKTDGTQSHIEIKNGSKGEKGDQPEKGVDYWNDEDKTEVKTFITDELAERGQLKPEFANDTSECIDTTKLYVLPDGYIYASVKKTGEDSVTPNFTNQIPISTDTDGSIYDSDGFAENMYLSSGVPASRSGIDCSGFIPIGCGSTSSASGEQVARMEGVTATIETTFRVALYDSSKTLIQQIYGTTFDSNTWGVLVPYETDDSGNVTMFDMTALTAHWRDYNALGEVAYMRICCPNIDENSIITVNEEIAYTTVEGGTYYEWENTGHAFVPADYEERIIELEEENNQLKTELNSEKQRIEELEESVDLVPEAVVTGVSNLIDKALSREGSKILRFIISADAHQKNDNELITKGTKELGQAHGEILKRIGVDFVANLGDITWGSSSSDNATVLEEGKVFNSYMLKNIRGEKQIWTEGNHETDMLTDSQIRALIYCHNKELVQDADNWNEGYGYMDFESVKVRVICLNTDQATGSDASGVSDAQCKWFAETALNMEGKTDWSIITMGHHPIGYNNVSLIKYCAYIVEAFISGSDFSLTTNSGTEIAIDYSDKKCQYIGHFHGHAHAYSAVKIQKYVSSGVYEEIDAWEICIPNACYERNNQYLNNGLYTARYSTETTYSKSDEDGLRTSFNLITVDLDNKIIYADNYGAGVDRTITY